MHESECGNPQITLRRIMFLVFGWALVLGGVVGLLLPVVPGTLLILAGGAVLSRQSSWAHRVLERFRLWFAQ